jgi:hypothetical protein
VRRIFFKCQWCLTDQIFGITSRINVNALNHYTLSRTGWKVNVVRLSGCEWFNVYDVMLSIRYSVILIYLYIHVYIYVKDTQVSQTSILYYYGIKVKFTVNSKVYHKRLLATKRSIVSSC